MLLLPPVLLAGPDDTLTVLAGEQPERRRT
jgi:hypothetical protein